MQFVEAVAPAVVEVVSSFFEAVGSFFSSFFDWPLAVNLVGGQVHTTALEGSSVYFDQQSNGHAVKTAWITPDEGFLVWNRTLIGEAGNDHLFSQTSADFLWDGKRRGIDPAGNDAVFEIRRKG